MQLNKNISLKEFKDSYFTVLELKEFCRKQKIPLNSSDRKIQITKKICEYLQNGCSSSASSTSKKIDDINKCERILADEQKIGAGFKFSRSARDYFEKTLDEKFKCNVLLLAWIKANPEKTIKDFKDKYLEVKESGEKLSIGEQFEYNQFTQDFFAANPKLTRTDCLKCWKKVRELKERKYSSKHLDFLKK